MNYCVASSVSYSLTQLRGHTVVVYYTIRIYVSRVPTLNLCIAHSVFWNVLHGGHAALTGQNVNLYVAYSVSFTPRRTRRVNSSKTKHFLKK